MIRSPAFSVPQVVAARKPPVRGLAIRQSAVADERVMGFRLVDDEADETRSSSAA